VSPGQRVCATGQPVPHAGAPPVEEHTGVAFAHWLPQRPQCDAPASDASQPLAGFASQSAKPASQVRAHVPAVHAADWLAPPTQALPQPPQCADDAWVLTSQPLVGSASQSANPGEHVIPQRPSAQVAVASGPAGHARPHAPQCSGLVWTSTQGPPGQRVCPRSQPELHAKVPPAPPHAGVVPVHATPQTPQWVVPERAASQPLDASPSQSAKPTAQGAVHTPAVQAGVALARAGHTPPQVPQFITSADVRRQAPAQHASPAGHACRSLQPGAHSPVGPHTEPAGQWPSLAQAAQAFVVVLQWSDPPSEAQSPSCAHPASQRLAGVQYCPAVHDPRLELVHATHIPVDVSHTRKPNSLAPQSLLSRQPGVPLSGAVSGAASIGGVASIGGAASIGGVASSRVASAVTSWSTCAASTVLAVWPLPQPVVMGAASAKHASSSLQLRMLAR